MWANGSDEKQGSVALERARIVNKGGKIVSCQETEGRLEVIFYTSFVGFSVFLSKSVAFYYTLLSLFCF
jgi:hypothetical protein